MKDLVKTIAAKEDQSLRCEIYKIDKGFYEVEYKAKPQYFTKNINVAILVAKVVLIFKKIIKDCNKILYSKKTEEEKWKTIHEMLRKIYQEKAPGRKIAMVVLEILEANYDEIKKVKDKETLQKLINIANFKEKDALAKLIKDITAMVEPQIAEKNYSRYVKLRNDYVEKRNLGIEKLEVA